MRPAYWAAVILLLNMSHLWMFLHLDLQRYPVATRIGIGVHLVACVGPFWMLYDWFIERKQKRWETWMWLFFVPWGFLWYYFEKYRPTKTGRRV